jgi:CRISPR-associated protein Cas2
MARDLFIVISYDITANKRRLKLARLLLDYGATRVQYSVFECYLGARQLDTLRARIGKVYKAEEDSVRIYLLCENCRPKVECMGQARPSEEPGLLII